MITINSCIFYDLKSYQSDDLETDYENITENYKAREGSLSERLTYMRALRHANTTANMYPGLKNNDVFLQIIDLDKGIYGQPFLVSLFLHVSSHRFLGILDLILGFHLQNQSRED